METENNNTPDIPAHDPANAPLGRAAETLAKCASTKATPLQPEDMLPQLRAALNEYSPTGQFRSANALLTAQAAILDSMFHVGVRNAVRPARIVVEHGSRENGFRDTYEDGDPYLDTDRTLLALKIQTQCRTTVEGMKNSEDKRKRRHLSKQRLRMQEKNQKS